MAAVIEEARAQTRGIVDLPEGEGIRLETVSDVPWLGFNFYQGGLRGKVAVNVGLKMSDRSIRPVSSCANDTAR